MQADLRVHVFNALNSDGSARDEPAPEKERPIASVRAAPSAAALRANEDGVSRAIAYDFLVTGSLNSWLMYEKRNLTRPPRPPLPLRPPLFLLFQHHYRSH